jgi:hypothetical protein
MQYADLINDIIPDCPGCPVPVAERAIRESIRSFAAKTGAYRKKLSASDMSYASGVYTITIPAGTQIESIISPMVFDGSYTVYTFTNGTSTYSSTNSVPLSGYTLTGTSNYSIDQTNVIGASPEWMDIKHPGWRNKTEFSFVEYFVPLSTNTFVLTPDSGTDRKSNLFVTIVLKPDRTTTTIDDEFGTRWFDTLVAGAKFLLMVMPKAEWSNPKLAQFYATKYDDGIEEARRYLSTGYRNPLFDGKRSVKLHYK